MKTTLTLLTIAAVAVAASAAEISGKVKLTGTPPPEKSTATDAACGKSGNAMVTSRHYVVGADKGLGDVFVYVKEGAKPTPPASDKAAVLDQVGCLYTPYMMGMQAGQILPVKNSDPLMHNAHMLPKAPGNKEKNLAQPVPMVSNFTIDKPEIFVQFKCDVHSWMFAYVGVVDHPYFAVTDKDGNFKISGLPAGDYTVEAIHRKAGSETQKIKIGADEKKTADFTLKVPAAP